MTIENLLEKENNNLDLIRIFLACLVIICHSPTLNGPSHFWIDPISFFFSISNSGAIAVKLFFFISGLVVTNSYLKNRNAIYFIISRFFRIIPALFFLIIITIFIVGPTLTTLPLNKYFNDPSVFLYFRNNIFFHLADYLPNIFENNFYPNVINGSLWSLRYEVMCYIWILIFFIILRKKNKYLLNIPIAIIIIDSILPTRILLNNLGEDVAIYTLPASFAFGALLAVNSEKLKLNSLTILITIVLGLIFHSTQFNQISFIFASSIVVLYISSNKYILKFKPQNDISYGIYLWGFLIQQTLYNFTGHIYTGYHCLFSIIISSILGYISYIYIEKPFIQYGKLIFNLINNKFPEITNKI